MADDIDNLLSELTKPKDSSSKSRVVAASSALSGQEDVPTESSSKRGLLALAAMLAIVLIAFGSFWIGTKSSSEISQEVLDPVTVDTQVSEVSPAPEAQTTTTEKAFTVEPTEDNPEGAFRWAVVSNGKYYIRGTYPTQEEADFALGLLAPAVGPDNIIEEYAIDPRVPSGGAAPVYIEDAVLFEEASAELRPEFRALLDPAPVFLAQDPNIKITVVGRTDASGSVETNLRIAEERADAVIQYYLSIGVDSSQLETDIRGEEGTVETDDPDIAARQRSVEFRVSGLLDSE